MTNLFSPPRHEATKKTFFRKDPPRVIKPIPETTDRLATQIVDAAYGVHSTLGPGLLESVYEACLVHELHKRGLETKRQVALPVIYDGVQLEAGLRLDILVQECIVVEVKAVETVLSVHKAQVLTYLKLSGHRLGFLINFNVHLIRNGISRIAL